MLYPKVYAISATSLVIQLQKTPRYILRNMYLEETYTVYLITEREQIVFLLLLICFHYLLVKNNKEGTSRFSSSWFTAAWPNIIGQNWSEWSKLGEYFISHGLGFNQRLHCCFWKRKPCWLFQSLNPCNNNFILAGKLVW